VSSEIVRSKISAIALAGLNLDVAAIITWNTVYLERAVASLTEQKTEIQRELLAHLSPLG
jgi:TnpA family transposase